MCQPAELEFIIQKVVVQDGRHRVVEDSGQVLALGNLFVDQYNKAQVEGISV